MASTEIKLTSEDYLKMPDDERHELLDGELVMAPAPRTDHQMAVMNLGSLLHIFVKEKNLGVVLSAPTDVVLSDIDVVQPDLLFISNERTHIITDENIQGAPDLIIEVLSPSTAERDRMFKLDLYARHGVKEYWLVDTDAKTVMVLLLGKHRFEVIGIYGEDQTLSSPTLTEFSLNVSNAI